MVFIGPTTCFDGRIVVFIVAGFVPSFSTEFFFSGEVATSRSGLEENAELDTEENEVNYRTIRRNIWPDFYWVS